MKRSFLGICHRIAYATAVGLAGFLLAVAPSAVDIDATGLFTRLLNLPVAAIGLLLPSGWRGIDLWFRPQEVGYLHFSDVLLQHLRIAIPVYVLIFYLPTLTRAIWQRLGHRREPLEEQAPSTRVS